MENQNEDDARMSKFGTESTGLITAAKDKEEWKNFMESHLMHHRENNSVGTSYNRLNAFCMRNTPQF